MSLVSYNDINLPYPFTVRFDQSPVYDDVGQVDWYCSRFDIQIQCILHLEYLSSISSEYSGITTGNAATAMNLLRDQLLQPRRKLNFVCNGVDLIPKRAEVIGDVDARNGPQPQSCSILQLTNETFLLSYHIIAHYWENYATLQGRSANLTGNPVLFNRWTETVEIDDCLYSRRTREGKYIIRSDNKEGFIADQLRDKMAVVGVPNGFMRESSRYTITPDGLGIQYQVVDKEVFKFPPKPAFQARGQYVLSTPKPGGAVCYGEVRLMLKGSKSAGVSSQNKLVEVAVATAANKLGINGASRLEYAFVTTDMYENIVEVTMKALCNAEGARFQNITMAKAFTNKLTITPGSESNSTAPQYTTRGTAAILLQAANYYDPSLRSTELGVGKAAAVESNPVPIGTNTQLSTGVAIGQAGSIRET